MRDEAENISRYLAAKQDLANVTIGAWRDILNLCSGSNILRAKVLAAICDVYEKRVKHVCILEEDFNI